MLTETILSVGKAVAIAAAKAIAGSTTRRAVSRHERDRLRDEAARQLISGAGSAHRRLAKTAFLGELSPPQTAAFLDYVESAQFENVIRQAMLAERDEPTTAALRGELWHGLRLRGFAEADLYAATDALEELMNAAIHTVRRALPAGWAFESGREVVTAAGVASAAVRNSELLSRMAEVNEINAFGELLRTAARSSHGKLEVAANGNRQRVTYSDLYVTPDLVPIRTLPPLTVVDTRLALDDLLDDYRRCVIVGDPGAGKSTLASKLAHDLAADRHPGLEDQVAILLRVREHTRSLRTDHQPLLHYLEAACRRPYNLSPPRHALEYMLLNERATVIIDGVDELGDTSDRRSFMELVEGFVNLYPLARVITTSRIVGYNEAPLDPGLFPIFHIRPFSEQQVHQYVCNWFTIEETESFYDDEPVAQEFLRASAPAEDLRSNALMLSLLCSLYSTKKHLPNNRPEIYNQCASFLFESWDRQRGIEVLHRYEAEIRPAVQKMALHVLTDSQGRQALPRSEWAHFLTRYLHNRRFADLQDAEAAASDFLDFCVGRAWVIADVGSDQYEPHYGFVHRTFMEYFAAAQLVRECRRPGAVLDRIAPRLADGSWQMVAQLALQILNKWSEDGADELLKTLLLTMGARSEASEYAFLCFMCEALEVVAPYSDTVDAIVKSAVQASCQVPAASRLSEPDAAYPRGDTSQHPAEPADEPLAGLLAVTSPDNVDRIADAVVRTLLQFADSLPENSSAGLLHLMLSDKVPTMVGRRVAVRLATAAVPAAAASWRRALTQPTVDDLRRHQATLLFRRASYFGLVLPTPLNCMIAGFTADQAERLRTIDDTLCEYLPLLTTWEAGRRALRLVRDEAPDDAWVWLVQQDGMLSPNARWSLKLLLWVNDPGSRAPLTYPPPL